MKPIFIHISKNAGTSILCTAGDAITTVGHRTAAKCVSEHGRSARLFAVIRNPFDRVVSEYYFRRSRYLRGEQNPHLSNLGKSFEEWTVSTYQDGEFRTRHFFEARGLAYRESNMIGDCLIWFLPQVLWISGDNGEVLVSETLCYETLGKDWARFSKKLGIDRELVHRNASARPKDYRDCYSNRSREIVYDYYRTDFDMFGYTFESGRR